MSLVAYLPVVEIIDKKINAENLANNLQNEFTPTGQVDLQAMLEAEAFPAACGPLHKREDFIAALSRLLIAKQDRTLTPESGGDAVDALAEFFGDPVAIRERIMAWLRDRHKQPAPKAGELRLEPTWVDFLVADLTWQYSAEGAPAIRVPPWLGEASQSLVGR